MPILSVLEGICSGFASIWLAAFPAPLPAWQGQPMHPVLLPALCPSHCRLGEQREAGIVPVPLVAAIFGVFFPFAVLPGLQ